jgi:exopolysaccharide biosynthesis protein
MTFDDLQRLGDRLALTDMLNLDGGGSTTMVVGDAIVNRPSDPAGPRPVGDAIIVTAK